MDGHRCADNECRCDHGQGASGPECTSHGSRTCADCDAHYSIVRIAHNTSCIHHHCSAFYEVRLTPLLRADQRLERPWCNTSMVGAECHIPMECLAPGAGGNAFMKGMGTVSSGTPPWLAALAAGLMLLIPSVAMICIAAPWQQKAEVIASAADASSDLLFCLIGTFFSASLAAAAWACAFGHALALAAWLYGVRIAKQALSVWLQHAFAPTQRLSAHGVHQVFEEHGSSLEKLLVDIVATVLLSVLAIVAPFAVLVYVVTKALLLHVLAATLQSVRLLHLSRVEAWLLVAVAARPQDDAALLGPPAPVSRGTYHRSVMSEILGESIPFLAINLLNHKLKLQAHVTVGYSWISALSLTTSAYMVLRMGYKYAYHLLYLQQTLDEIPLPGTSSPKEKAEVAAGVAAAVYVAVDGIVDEASGVA